MQRWQYFQAFCATYLLDQNEIFDWIFLFKINPCFHLNFMTITKRPLSLSTSCNHFTKLPRHEKITDFCFSQYIDLYNTSAKPEIFFGGGRWGVVNKTMFWWNNVILLSWNTAIFHILRANCCGFCLSFFQMLAGDREILKLWKWLWKAIICN